MRQPMRRAAAIVATAALAISLSACTGGHWVPDAPPAAGAQTDLGGFKLRNVAVVTNTTGEAILLAGITSRDAATEVVGITVAPELEDGSFGPSVPISFAESIPAGKTILLDGSRTQFTDEGLLLGRLAEVSVQFSNGETASLQAPVISYEHPDFAQSWAHVYA